MPQNVPAFRFSDEALRVRGLPLVVQATPLAFGSAQHGRPAIDAAGRAGEVGLAVLGRIGLEKGAHRTIRGLGNLPVIGCAVVNMEQQRFEDFRFQQGAQLACRKVGVVRP